jgi:hypothetical protein
MSVTAWIYPRTFGGGGGYGVVFNNGALMCYMIGWDASFACVQNYGGNPALAQSGAIALNQWQLLTIVRKSDGTVTLYVNGVRSGLADQNVGTPDLSGQYFIGSRFDGLYPFNGLIDEMRVYNRTLSPSEIQVIYQLP